MPDADGSLHYRLATEADAEAIADLHARSKQATYRGLYSDAYLDGPILAERRFFWAERFAHPRSGLWVMLAERDGQLAGFICLMDDHDPHWGSLINNLHVDPAMKRQGIGLALLRTAADHLLHALPRRPVYLLVLTGNHAARDFYEKLGAEAVEEVVGTDPSGAALAELRYTWPSVAAFAEGVS